MNALLSIHHILRRTRGNCMDFSFISSYNVVNQIVDNSHKIWYDSPYKSLDVIAMANGFQHVVPNINGQWAVKKSGSNKATKLFETKNEAVSYGTKVSKNQESVLIIHKKNGTIEKSKNYQGCKK